MFCVAARMRVLRDATPGAAVRPVASLLLAQLARGVTASKPAMQPVAVGYRP